MVQIALPGKSANMHIKLILNDETGNDSTFILYNNHKIFLEKSVIIIIIAYGWNNHFKSLMHYPFYFVSENKWTSKEILHGLEIP